MCLGLVLQATGRRGFRGLRYDPLTPATPAPSPLPDHCTVLLHLLQLLFLSVYLHLSLLLLQVAGATERGCVTRRPSDGKERCAQVMRGYKKVCRVILLQIWTKSSPIYQLLASLLRTLFPPIFPPSPRSSCVSVEVISVTRDQGTATAQLSVLIEHDTHTEEEGPAA